MNLQQLVQASEILENLESIEFQIHKQNKQLSANGLKMINEIIEDCYDALSEKLESEDKGRKEFERINFMILDLCMRIKMATESSLFSRSVA